MTIADVFFCLDFILAGYGRTLEATRRTKTVYSVILRPTIYEVEGRTAITGIVNKRSPVKFSAFEQQRDAVWQKRFSTLP